MELKNRQIGILIQDQTLRRMLHDLLVKNGVRVSCVADLEELELLTEKLGIEVAIIELRNPLQEFCLN